MRSIKTSSLVRSALAVSLLFALGAGAAHAGSIADSYATGDTLDAAKMTNIKNAVNDNDTRITALQNGTQTCGAGMTRVGPTCVDNTLQAATGNWSVAVDTCRTANKRLLTPGEYVAAKNAGTIPGMTVLEWVDSVAMGNGPAFTMLVGAIGPGTTGGTAEKLESYVNYTYNNSAGETDTFQYRCAR
jgi:hypothetical protein